MSPNHVALEMHDATPGLRSQAQKPALPAHTEQIGLAITSKHIEEHAVLVAELMQEFERHALVEDPARLEYPGRFLADGYEQLVELRRKPRVDIGRGSALNSA